MAGKLFTCFVLAILIQLKPSLALIANESSHLTMPRAIVEEETMVNKAAAFLLNSIRTSHKAKTIEWNENLQIMARNCANEWSTNTDPDLVECTSLTSTGGVKMASELTNPSPTEVAGESASRLVRRQIMTWYNDGIATMDYTIYPPANDVRQATTQIIWINAIQFACAKSTLSPTVISCVFSPALNPTNYAQNVARDFE